MSDWQLVEKMREDPALFVEGVLSVKMWSGMYRIIDSVWQHKRTSVRACHGISKTFSAAAVAVTFLNLYRNAVVITTAPVGRQVKDLLWKEIGGFYARENDPEAVSKKILNWKLLGECQSLRVRMRDEENKHEDAYYPEWFMMGFSTDNATSMEGYHAPYILWVLDEAKGLPLWLYDSVEGSLTGGFSRVLEISTTDGADQLCPFRTHHTSRKRGWNSIHLSAFDSPFVDPDDFPELNEALQIVDPDWRAERLCDPELYEWGKPRHGTEWDLELTNKIQIATKEWVLDRVDDWRDEKHMIETKVFGNFSMESAFNIIPIQWIESAIAEQEANTVTEVDDNGLLRIIEGYIEYGLDVARTGTDKTVLTKKVGGTIQRQLVTSKLDTMEVVGWTRQKLAEDQRGPDAEDLPTDELFKANQYVLKIDMIGVGAGVFDRLSEDGFRVIGVNSSEKAIYEENKYLNLRAEMWFATRDMFRRQFYEGGILSLPDDDELAEDLAGMKYKYHSSNRQQVEKKEDFKKRYKRSPDKGDSFIYAMFQFPPVVEDDYVEGSADGVPI